MRSNEERDKIIGVLFTRVQVLEDEIAKFKGEHLSNLTMSH